MGFMVPLNGQSRGASCKGFPNLVKDLRQNYKANLNEHVGKVEILSNSYQYVHLWVVGRNDYAWRKQLWEDSRDISNDVEYAWAIIKDFNLIMTMEE
ncbi:hypothetical protein CR513_55010, partial [Mucuna pruriens]